MLGGINMQIEMTKEQYAALEKLISYKEYFDFAMATKPHMKEFVAAYYYNKIKVK